MGNAFVFCRFWTGFTSAFPFDRFNDLHEEQLESELRAIVEREGPPDDAIIEWLNEERQRTLAGSVGPVAQPPPSLASPSPQWSPKLRSWLENRDKNRASVASAAREHPHSPRHDYLFVRKLQFLRWVTTPVIWNWGFLKRHTLLVVETEGRASDLAKALTQRYCEDPARPHFGIIFADAVTVPERMLLEQAADRSCAGAASNNSMALADIARCAVDLLNRLRPATDRVAAAAIDAASSMAATSVSSKGGPRPPTDEHADGPAAPNLVWYNGKSATIEPIPWKLLDYAWRQRTAKETDVIEAVWGHDSTKSAESEHPLKSAIRKANHALSEVSCPLHLGRKNGFITLN